MKRSTKLQSLSLAWLVAGAAGPAEAQCPSDGHCQFPKLTAGDAAAGGVFGRSTAMRGEFLLVGADGNRAAYVFRSAGGVWQQQAQLAGGGGAVDDGFGFAVAMTEDWALIGAPDDGQNGTSAGAAYLYHRVGGAWLPHQKLVASNGLPFDQFGYSVGIDGDTLIIGSPKSDLPTNYSGAAYVFRRGVGDVWSEFTILNNTGLNDQFGFAVGMSGAYLAVGAFGDDDAGVDAGAVYIYRDVGHVVLEQKLTGDDAVPADGGANDWFGSALAINDTDLVVGAYGNDDVGSNSGSAYTFRLTLNPFPTPPSWEFNTKLAACDAQTLDNFGYSVGIDPDGGRIVVGAPFEDEGGASAGAAYVFDRTPVVFYTWQQSDKLVACDAAAGDRFGRAVAVNDDYPAVGAYLDDDAGVSSGSAYVFSMSGAGQSCLCDCKNAATNAQYGEGKGGALGVPVLSGHGLPVIGQVSGITLSNGMPGAFPILFLGLTEAKIPFDEGALLVGNPLVFAIPVAIPGNGVMTLDGLIPANPALCGVKLYHQMMYVDTTASGFNHTAQTNGLVRTFGS